MNAPGIGDARGVGGVRWLVTGARGQLGTALVDALADRDVTATGRAELDVLAPEDALRTWARGAAGRPLVVLNAAAWT
ncbi:MAG: sugar nucleotide-binding protein, partial [Actinomycetota bacterium]|nr:sugar nucleotide-binding protein [Actinomycetota bacterium]